MKMRGWVHPYCKCWMSGSSQDFCSVWGPTQWRPPPLGVGLLHVRVLDLWPPEQGLQEDQQLQLPWITPGWTRGKDDDSKPGWSEERSVLSSHRRPHSCFLPGCSPVMEPVPQAGPEVPGRQTQRQLVPVSRGSPLFWQGWQRQGCCSARYSSVARFRCSFFKPAHCTSFTSSYKGRSWNAHSGFRWKRSKTITSANKTTNRVEISQSFTFWFMTSGKSLTDEAQLL